MGATTIVGVVMTIDETIEEMIVVTGETVDPGVAVTKETADVPTIAIAAAEVAVNMVVIAIVTAEAMIEVLDECSVCLLCSGIIVVVKLTNIEQHTGCVKIKPALKL